MFPDDSPETIRYLLYFFGFVNTLLYIFQRCRKADFIFFFHYSIQNLGIQFLYVGCAYSELCGNFCARPTLTLKMHLWEPSNESADETSLLSWQICPEVAHKMSKKQYMARGITKSTKLM